MFWYSRIHQDPKVFHAPLCRKPCCIVCYIMYKALFSIATLFSFIYATVITLSTWGRGILSWDCRPLFAFILVLGHSVGLSAPNMLSFGLQRTLKTNLLRRLICILEQDVMKYFRDQWPRQWNGHSQAPRAGHGGSEAAGADGVRCVRGCCSPLKRSVWEGYGPLPRIILTFLSRNGVFLEHSDAVIYVRMPDGE